ncbi:MAG: DUF411 domain-containing protein [Hyphomicrobiales bacterium]
MAATLFAATAVRAGEKMEVLTTSGCGCCVIWIEYLREAGFEVSSSNVAMGTLMQAKMKAGLRPGLTSCHTGRIGGYVVEGHVPVREIRRLLAERPDAIGLTVPDMPLGSPGMDTGDKREPYDVLLLRKDGATEVYASYR